MQAVHWVVGTGAYTPDRTHGPRMGTTTVQVAQVLAELNPCRPGVEYLTRRTGLSRRTVQYHLEMLRESGLLAYVVKGTRVRGERPRASEFVRTIPAAYDTALGIRTRGTGPTRRVIGIADEGRALVAKLAKKAARKVRRTRRTKRTTHPAKQPAAARARCTPMEGGCSRSSRAGSPGIPPESKLGSGKDSSSTPKTNTAPRRLNAVGRRFQLAHELVQQLAWLSRASVPRIAWIIRDVADAGWTATEVIAVVGQEPAARRVRRPSGFLAHRLRGAHLLYDTPAKRAAIVAWWRENCSADRHAEWDGAWQAPRSRAVARMVDTALAAMTPASPTGPELTTVDGIEGLDEDELGELRRTARYEYLAGRTDLVTSAVSLLGREQAEQLYGRDLVNRVLRLAATSGHLRTGVCR
jgi:DNA-binding transcriptional ArsR family regulator